MEDTAIPYELPEVENHCCPWIWQTNGRRHIATFRSRRRSVNTTVHATPLGIFTGFGRR